MDLTAKTPEEIDTLLEAAFLAKAKNESRTAVNISHLHSIVGDKQTYVRYGRGHRQVWGLTDAEVLAVHQAPQSYNQNSFENCHKELLRLKEELISLRAEIATYNEEFERRGGWSRFFLVQGGHIHSSMSCSTCNNGEHLTSFGWLPALSGLTEKDAVEAHGALLCTVCFPSAPVEWTNGRELEAAAKAAEKCGGTYDQEEARKNHYRRYQKCTTCGTMQSITSTGKMRAHKAK